MDALGLGYGYLLGGFRAVPCPTKLQPSWQNGHNGLCCCSLDTILEPRDQTLYTVSLRSEQAGLLGSILGNVYKLPFACSVVHLG